MGECHLDQQGPKLGKLFHLLFPLFDGIFSQNELPSEKVRLSDQNDGELS